MEKLIFIYILKVCKSLYRCKLIQAFVNARKLQKWQDSHIFSLKIIPDFLTTFESFYLMCFSLFVLINWMTNSYCVSR